jgi:putative endonuclease
MAILNKKEIGEQKERLAIEYLQTHGLQFVAKNYHCPFGEIDLIMADKDEIVFVEVRSRKNNAYGSAIESVDHFKQRKLLKSATYYLQKKELLDNINCRFDVIGFSNNRLHWIKDAFSYE